MCKWTMQRLSGHQDVQLTIVLLRWEVEHCVRWILKLIYKPYPYWLGWVIVPTGLGSTNRTLSKSLQMYRDIFPGLGLFKRWCGIASAITTCDLFILLSRSTKTKRSNNIEEVNTINHRFYYAAIKIIRKQIQHNVDADPAVFGTLFFK